MNGFETLVLTGENLLDEAEKIHGMNRRNMYPEIQSFMFDTNDHYVGILYGLRRTGKTTLMRQLISELCDRDLLGKTALFLLDSSNSMDELLRDMQKLKDDGYLYLLLDEVTEVSDFSDSCSLLSDYFSGSGGMRVLLSGTNSLMFNLVRKHELYDRVKLFNITFVPYEEYIRLHPRASINDFLKRSGVASSPKKSPFLGEETTLEYIDTAIAKNINYSLERYRDGECFLSLRELYAKDILIGVIHKIVNSKDHSILYKDITHSHSVYLGVDKLSGEELYITQTQLNALRQHLLDLCVIKECYHFVDGTEDSPTQEIIFTQPGLRYSVANAAWGNLSSEIENDILGRVLEDTVLLELMLKAETVWGKITEVTPFVSRYNIRGDKELDAMILNPTDCSCTLIEVKHSDAYVPESQCRWLVDPTIEADIQNNYDPSIFKRVLVYTGDSRTCEELGVSYVNAHEFLTNISRYIF